MTDETVLADLLSVWQRQREEGRDVPATVLCPDRPELAEELQRRIGALRRLEDLARGATPADDTQTKLSAGPAGDATRPRTATARRGTPAVPGYEILGELGRGGMGVVYKARQLGLDRLVALKMILAGGHAGAAELARFKTEGEAVARLQHVNIVQIHEVGEHDGLPFFSLEFCGGGSLERKLAGTPLTPADAAALVESLARAMQAAHDKGVVHRDLKPANVLLADDGTPKITDFGLAKKLDEAGQTTTGAVMGTPPYMAPEQAGAKAYRVGPATDVYALGAMLYECLTGRPPFRAASTMDTLMQVMSDEPVPPHQMQPRTPRDLETICLKCLQKDPAKRYASAHDLAEDLRRFRAGEPIRARPVGHLERGWRWCRRNPAVAASLLTVALSLLAGSAVAVAFGVRAEQARRDEAERARSESAAKLDAEQAHREAQRQLVDLCVASGMVAAKENDQGLAVLWFARAAQLSKDDPRQEELNRIRVANWLRQVCLPEGTFTVPDFRQRQDKFRAFQLSPDGKYLLVIAASAGCLVWDRPAGRLVALPEPAAKATAAAWQPRSGLLAVAGPDGQIRFLAPPEFRPAAETVPAGQVTALAFSKDGQRLAWGGPEGARVWDVTKNEYMTPPLAHPAPVLSVSFSSAGGYLATSARDFKARVFRVGADQREPLFAPVPHWPGEYDAFTHGGADRFAPRFASADQILLTAELTRQGTYALVLRSALTGQFLTSNGTKDHLSSFALSPRGDAAVALWHYAARLLATANGGVLAALDPGPPNGPGRFSDATFNAAGSTLVTCGHDGALRFWSVDDRPDFGLNPSGPPVWNPMQAVRVELSPDGRHVAAALWDGRVCLWQLPEGPPTAYTLPTGSASLTTLSPDGRYVLPRGVSHRSGTLTATRVYHADSGRAAGPMLDPGGVLLDAAFSPDGTRVATASSAARAPDDRGRVVFAGDGKGGRVQLWDWKSGKRLARPIPMPGEPRGLAFRPDGGALAAVCADYHVLLIDPATGAVLHDLDPGVRTRQNPDANQWWSNGEARFSPDGRLLVTWEMSPHVHVWDADSGRLLHTLPHDERVGHVAFSPTDPTVLATASWDTSARVWDLKTGKLLARLRHPQWPTRVRFSPDGRELVTSCGDTTLRVWDWESGTLKDGVSFPNVLHDFGFAAGRRWLVTLGPGELQVTDWQSRTAVGPPWGLRQSFGLELAIPGGDRRALVGAFADSLVGYDLEKMAAPAAGPVEDLVRLAELAAGRRILSEGRVVPLTSAEWAERWQAYHAAGTAEAPAQ